MTLPTVSEQARSLLDKFQSIISQIQSMRDSKVIYGQPAVGIGRICTVKDLKDLELLLFVVANHPEFNVRPNYVVDREYEKELKNVKDSSSSRNRSY